MLEYKNMGGGLMQLVAYGAQDIYLTGNPQITFFKVVYRRHTNFSMEAIFQTLNGSGTITDGTNSTCTVSRNGDLVSKVYVNFPGTSATDGSAAIKEVELEIGGQRIDRHYQEWNEVWNELTTPESKAIGLKSMQRCIGGAGTGVTNVQVPLNFWFCRNPGLALPLIALQYHEVKMKFTWGDVDGPEPVPTVYCDYIYLDTDERRRFAQVSHEYLIEQLQREEKTGATSGDISHKLNFNHPVKELIWTSDAGDTLSNIKLTLNGHDRFSEQVEEYFSLRQPFDYHTAVPKQNLPTVANLSLLQRNTTFTTYTNMDVVMKQFNSEATTAQSSDNVHYNADTGKLNIELNGHPITVSQQPQAGDQIAIVCTIVSTATTAGIAGNVYFANVLTSAVAVPSQTGLYNCTITPPTTLDGVLISTTFAHTNGRYFIYKVTNGASSQARTSKMVRKIGVYSFALKPEEHQPSGTCNFSRIDSAQLKVTHTTETPFRIYAVNYNVLRIMSGMGGLAYSN